MSESRYVQLTRDYSLFSKTNMTKYFASRPNNFYWRFVQLDCFDTNWRRNG